MAYAMTKRGSLDNEVTYEFICDTLTDMNNIENKYRTIGSIAIVLEGDSGGLEVYITGSNKEWTALTAGASGDTAGAGGLSIYICAQDEVDNGLPDIEVPDESTIYLVASGNDSGNLYEEYIWVDDAWEKFGSAGIDLSGYATKTDTVLNTTLSRGRKAETTVGNGSFAFGDNVEASGAHSHAEGRNTVANAPYSHAEGGGSAVGSIASGNYSHAEGSGTTASGASSHAEGQDSISKGARSHAEGYATKTVGQMSHAEGIGTIANGMASHIAGQFNNEDSYSLWPEWASNTEYSVGDKIKVTTIDNNETIVKGYICKTANSDAEFTVAKWTRDGKMNYAEIIGNGISDNDRSNARALDWDGNEYLAGDVYVGCNSDSTGGTRVPHDVQINGVSVVDSNGVANIGLFEGSLIQFYNGKLLVNSSTESHIRYGSSIGSAIIPKYQHNAVFYGLAKIAGHDEKDSSLPIGTYTSDAKSAISNMLNAPESISGTTPSITAKSGIQYICGECSTLSIVAPESGCIDVLFESGSTPTVLTVTSAKSGVTAIKWAGNFDPTSLDANTTYEINILNGEYGVMGSWT